MTILVVDDDAVLCRFLTELLQDAGYSVVIAANGLEALSELRQANPQPCLILLDMTMPIMDGWTFREQQLQDPHLATIPVVFISAVAHHRVQAAVSGAHHLLKPFIFKTCFKWLRASAWRIDIPMWSTTLQPNVSNYVPCSVKSTLLSSRE